MVGSSLNATDIAIQAGLSLKKNGTRFWTCCPLHGEKTPSMCFFPDGKFHCFGCGAHGDAADLYAALNGVPLAEALRIVKGGDFVPKTKAPTAADLRRKVEEWKSARWAQACAELHEAQATIILLESTYIATQLMELEAYWTFLERIATAKDTLNLLESASPAQVLKMCEEDKGEHTKMN